MRWLPALTEDPVGSWGQQKTSRRQARQSSVESNSREGEKITNTIGKKEATKNYCWLNICYAKK